MISCCRRGSPVGSSRKVSSGVWFPAALTEENQVKPILSARLTLVVIMGTDMVKILFVTPAFTRVGSEVALYNIIANADPGKFHMMLASYGEGELLQQLPDHITYFSHPAYWRNVEKREKNPLIKTYNKLYRRLVKMPDNEFLYKIHQKYRPDYWYINTNNQPYILEFAVRFNIPVILHVHELEQTLANFTRQQLKNIAEYPRLIIACSQAVFNVMQTLGRKKNMEVCYPAVDISRITASPAQRNQVRQKLGIGEDTFVWAMSGYFDFNKNPVRFIELLKLLLEKGKQCHFVWVGGNPDNGLAIYARMKTAEWGIADRITWTGALTDDYYHYLQAADGFVLTSTRDSCPIASIEAIALGKPVVALASGGISEVMQEGMGFVNDSLNNEDLAEKMILIMEGKYSFDKEVSMKRACFFDIRNQVEIWEKIMLTHIN